MNLNEIKPTEWSAMNIDQLLTQKSIMMDRYAFFISKGYTAPASKMLEGIEKLDSLILGA